MKNPLIQKELLPTQGVSVSTLAVEPLNCRNCPDIDREACTTLMTYGQDFDTPPTMRSHGLCVQATETEI